MKRLKLLFCIMLGLFVMSGCTNVPKEKQIIEDLKDYGQKDLLSDGEEIVDLSIEDRQTDKERKTDYVTCAVTTKKEEVSYEKQIIVEYHLYDQGWEIDYVTVNISSEWVISPLKGVSEERIAKTIVGEKIELTDGDTWEINDGEVSNVSITNQETNLEEKKDKVFVEIELKGLVEILKVEVILDYTFDENWEISSIDVNSTELEMIKGKEFGINENDLIEALEGYAFSYGEENSNKQEISIGKNELIDLKVTSQEAKAKGTEQQIECSAVLNKKNVNFDLKINIGYSYDDEWSEQSITIDAEVKEINLLGKWSGRYVDSPYSGNSVLEITEVDGDNITAIYYYKPDTISEWSEAGSYKVSGTINREKMVLNLEAGDWLEKPTKESLYKQDIYAILYVDDGMIKGKAQFGKVFEVTKEVTD